MTEPAENLLAIDDERSTYFVDVILPLYLPKAYTYRVPLALNEKIAVGKRVVVQFGNRRIYAALIVDIHQKPPAAYTAKYIHDVLDEKPLISTQQLNFWKWVEEYYLCTLGEVMDAALPGGLKLESETKLYLNPEAVFEYGDLDDKEYLVVEALEIHKEISIDQINELLRIKSGIPLIKSLFEKGIVLIREQLNETYKIKKQTCIRLAHTYHSEKKLQELFDQLEKSPKQLDIVMAFLSGFKSVKDVPKKALLKAGKFSESSLNTLINKKVFETYEIEIDRISTTDRDIETYELTPKQEQAFVRTKELFQKHEVVLMHGVTSSGKTLVYSRLMQEVIDEGRQVLYLLPEVALTSQIIQRLSKLFGNAVCVWHYKFNEFERVEIWNKIREGRFKIVIGTRSAVFLPFKDLGLVIVDEEHDQSFKQMDPAPRYHGRDAAVVLASMYKAKTLLGTATPSVESYYNVQLKKYGLVEMPDRYAGLQLPEIALADVSRSSKDKTLSYHFTPELLDKIKEAWMKKEQVILFQNRKGYAPMLECASCAWTPHCVNCDIALAYYKTQHILKCHYCGYKTKPVNVCSACGNTHMKMMGFGTEKIEDDLINLLPDIRVARLDYNTTRTKEGHQKIIQDFKDHQIDVLVGTQMVSKGLDFENVTLVGIMDADQIINIPDFRANERAFQMLTQVSGRAGRFHKRGEVIIQTRRPGLDIFKLVIENNYQDLYLYELAERKKFEYPPFSKLIRFTVKHKEEVEAARAAIALSVALRGIEAIKVLGPEAHYIHRIQNLFIQNILVKVPHHEVSLKQVKGYIRQIVSDFQALKENRAVRVYLDVDCF